MARHILSDNGPKLISTVLMKWALEQQIATAFIAAFIDPDKPWQKATNESFNGKFWDERLAMEWFRNRFGARIVIQDWRTHYNEVRSHSSLRDATPAECRRNCEFGSTTEATNP